MLEVGWPDPAEVLDRMESTRSCWPSSAASVRSTSVMGVGTGTSGAAGSDRYGFRCTRTRLALVKHRRTRGSWLALQVAVLPAVARRTAGTARWAATTRR